jgi:hypothetical protein
MHAWFNLVLALAVVLSMLALVFVVGYDQGLKHREPAPPAPPEPEPKPEKREPWCVRVGLRNGQTKIFHQVHGAEKQADGTLAVIWYGPSGKKSSLALFHSWAYTDAADYHEKCPEDKCPSQASKP